MRPPDGGLAQVVGRCSCRAYAEAPRQARRSHHGQTCNHGEVENGPQYLNKNPLMFTYKGHTIDDVEAGAGNPVCSARLA